jgi:hypothetical protein
MKIFYRLGWLVLFAISASGLSALTLTFTNNTGLADSDVYIFFQDPITATFAGTGNTVESQKSYSLATIGTGINITTFNGGRFFSSLGAPFPADTNPPQFVNPPSGPGLESNNSYNNRHQLIGEITTGAVANLSNIDWVAQPAAMVTYDAGNNQIDRIGYANGYNSATLGTKLSGLTGGDAQFNSIANLAGNDPTYYSQTGSGTTASQSPAVGSPVRIIGGSQTAFLVSEGLTSYPSFQGYINSIIANNPGASEANPIARLSGQFFLDGTTYSAKVTSIEAPTVGDPSYSFGQVTIEGTTSDEDDFVIIIPYESLTNSTIYGGTTGSPDNPDPTNEKGIGYLLSINGDTPEPTDGGANTVYTLAVRDFFAGLNYGFIDSPEINPNDPTLGTAYKDSESAYWGTTNLLTGATNPETPLFFEELQKDDPFYNAWAKVIFEESGGTVYGFAYDDTFNKVQIGVGDGVDRLDIILFGDVFTAIPEPSTYALIVALTVFVAVGIRRRLVK